MEASARLDAEGVSRALHAAFCRDASRSDLLQLAATKIQQTGEPYTGVYLYMLHGDDLELEAFAGRPTDLTRIPVGEGICGQAIARREDIDVPDVSLAEGYLACSVATRSELVVLIRRHDEILGEIDVDSDTPNGFGTLEHAAVKQVADALAALL